MKILGIVLAAFVLVLVGGVIYLGIADIHIDQTPVTKNIEPAGN